MFQIVKSSLPDIIKGDENMILTPSDHAVLNNLIKVGVAQVLRLKFAQGSFLEGLPPDRALSSLQPGQ